MPKPPTSTARPIRTASTAVPTDTGAPRGCTNFKLRRLTRRVSQHYDHLVAAAGLKTTQYSMLSHIVQLGPIRPGELAQRLDMDASTLTRNLQPLVAQGWVELGEGSDARSRSVTATTAGRAKRSEAQREWKRAQLALNEKLGADRVAQLHTLLDDCLAALNDSAGGSDE
jgi:DNA-binding MarR family transcriptional regulator